MLPNNTILNELNEILAKPVIWPTNTPYVIPQHYFNTATLQSLKPLLNNSQVVPPSYFDTLPQIIIQRITEAEKASVPANYFENFSANLMQKIKANELEAIAPTLSKIGNKNIYQAPNGYFEKPIQVSRPKKGTLLSILYKYTKPMVAAVLILSCGITYFALKPADKVDAGLTEAILLIENNAIPITPNNNLTTDYVAALNDVKVNDFKKTNIDEALNEINEDELYAYVDNHAIGANFAESVFENSSITSQNNNIQLEEVSDEDLEAFLKENIK
jgi:hypothetical protein